MIERTMIRIANKKLASPTTLTLSLSLKNYCSCKCMHKENEM